MAPRIGPSQRLETGTSLRVDPRVVLGSQLLQLSQTELEQAIESELNENPALERLDGESEPITDEQILRAVAPRELRHSAEDSEYRRSVPDHDELPDWIELAPTTHTLLDHLRAQLFPMLPSVLRPLGEYLVESVNEKGYLMAELEEAALATGRSLDEAKAVLAVLQSCEPAGVGARSIQECLLLQLRDPSSYELKLARKIVRQCLDDFVARRTMQIARRFKVMPDLVEAAFAEILRLNPFPGEGFVGSSGSHLTARTFGVAPDMRLSRSDTGWTVDVLGPDPSSLRVSRAYQRRVVELERRVRGSNDEKRHLDNQMRRATDFITCLEQRRRTMAKIGEYLVTHQSGFVSTGHYQFLNPLTRCKMAKDIGVHESTVSRATMDKFVQIANGEVVPFEVFFKPALRVQKMIEEILATENPNNPLSDETIAKMLAKRGVIVARRTVNKYRDRTKLLSSRKRRSA